MSTTSTATAAFLDVVITSHAPILDARDGVTRVMRVYVAGRAPGMSGLHLGAQACRVAPAPYGHRVAYGDLSGAVGLDDLAVMTRTLRRVERALKRLPPQASLSDRMAAFARAVGASSARLRVDGRPLAEGSIADVSARATAALSEVCAAAA